MKLTPEIERAMRSSGLDPESLRGRPPAEPVAPRGRNKYGAKPTTYAGVRYASKAEAARAAELDASAPMGVWWVGQPKFRLGCPENVYVADFLVLGLCKAGAHVEDVKGVRTSKFARDLKLWRAYGPCELWVITGKKVEIIPGKAS